MTDPDTVADLAELWAEEWPCAVDDSGIALTAPFSAPSAGPPPWHVYRIDASGATALQTVEPGGATRWIFSLEHGGQNRSGGFDAPRHR